MNPNILNTVRRFEPSLEEQGASALVESAERFLDGFRWAKRTGAIWVGECVPGVLGLFLVELDPPEPDIDKLIWVVVGDVPPAYISSVYAQTPREALVAYVAEMEAWVEAVEHGQSVDDLIPVNGVPTIENAEALKIRLGLIGREILPFLR